jgi:hypothetical protein
LMKIRAAYMAEHNHENNLCLLWVKFREKP